MIGLCLIVNFLRCWTVYLSVSYSNRLLTSLSLPGTHKFITLRHPFPSVDGFSWAEVER